MTANNYIEKSLELHLFFGRIMKEHALFIAAGFTPACRAFAEKADYFKKEFETLLCKTVTLANGVINRRVLQSREIVTQFTALAERQTECLTGIGINKEITAAEQKLNSNSGRYCENIQLRNRIQELNTAALELLDGLICLKETVLKCVLCGEIFTSNYPMLIEHIIREARLYRDYISSLEKHGCITERTQRETECFWNRIMMEHAMFIRGLIDPCESDLINAADDFAKQYGALLEECRNAQDKITAANSAQLTRSFRDFKIAGTQGIEECKIRSIILPLLADHVLREANHYLRLLGRAAPGNSAF